MSVSVSLLEQFGAQVAGRADTLRGEGHLAGILLGIGDQILEIVDRKRGMGDQHVRNADHVDDRHEILLRIVRQLLHMRQDRQDAVIAHQECVAVGVGLGDVVGARNAGAAGAVFDDDGLARVLADRLGQRARGNIGDAAGGDWDDQADRLVGIALGDDLAGRECPGGCEAGGEKDAFEAGNDHGFPPCQAGPIMPAAVCMQPNPICYRRDEPFDAAAAEKQRFPLILYRNTGRFVRRPRGASRFMCPRWRTGRRRQAC